MTTNFEMVQEFHDKFSSLQRFTSPTLMNVERFELRSRLIDEEFDELIDAWNDRAIIEIADALGDLLYVVYGTADEFGIDINAVFAEIHRSNMTKGTEGEVLRRDDGKVLKGPNYEPPQIAKVLGLQ